MSLIGTSIAAGVAQTALQAQQVARARDKQSAQPTRDARRVREILEANLQALHEGDESDTVAQLHIDAQLPEHQSPLVNRKPGAHHDGDKPVEATDAATTQPQMTEPSSQDGDKPLYRHLDVKA